MENQPAPLWATQRGYEAVRTLYEAQPEWRPTINTAATGTAAERQSILEWAKAWLLVRHVIPLSQAERKWGVKNLRQNRLDHPYRWQSGNTWLTTTTEMERCYGPKPAQEAHHDA